MLTNAVGHKQLATLNKSLHMPVHKVGLTSIAFISPSLEDKALSESLPQDLLNPALVEKTITPESQRAQRLHRAALLSPVRGRDVYRTKDL
jgi:hypothetical protein